MERKQYIEKLMSLKSSTTFNWTNPFASRINKSTLVAGCSIDRLSRFVFELVGDQKIFFAGAGVSS